MITNDEVEKLLDLNLREYIILLPFVLLIILFGVYPNMIIDLTAASTTNLIDIIIMQLNSTNPIWLALIWK